MRQLTRADVQRAAPTAAAARVDYAPVFYPSATDIRAAATIALAVSEERTGVDITMQLVPTATISGTVTAPAGALPQFLSVRLAPASGQVSMRAGAGLRALSTQPAADGRYLFTNVPPGSYTIKAVVGGGRGAPANIPKQWAAAEVNVSGQDLDVPLSLQPAVAVNGHVVFEGAQPTAADLQALSVTLVPPGTGGTPQNDGGGHVDGDGRFTFAGLTPDTYQFVTTWTSARARDTWTLKASTVNGRDAFESPLRVNPNEKLDWTLTFTDTPTTLTGTLKDTSGRPATDYYMLIFSTDRLYWIPGSRRVRMTRPATDGSYTVKGLPAGEYYLAAPADLENSEWNDPSLLERLAASSARITLRDGETTVRDFRIGGP